MVDPSLKLWTITQIIRTVRKHACIYTRTFTPEAQTLEHYFRNDEQIRCVYICRDRKALIDTDREHEKRTVI